MKFSWSRTVGDFQIWRVISPALPGITLLELEKQVDGSWKGAGQEEEAAVEVGGKRDDTNDTVNSPFQRAWAWHRQQSFPAGMGLRGVSRLIVIKWSNRIRRWLLLTFSMTLPCGLNTSEWHMEYRKIGLSLDVILKLMCGLVRPRTLAGPGNMSTVEELVSNVPEKSTTTTTTKTLKNSTECVHWDIHQGLCDGSSRRKGQSVDTAAWKQKEVRLIQQGIS